MTRETISIQLNGAPTDVPAGDTLEVLLARLGLGGPGLAVARNDSVVRRHEYGDVRLDPGDRIEIIQAVGGG